MAECPRGRDRLARSLGVVVVLALVGLAAGSAPASATTCDGSSRAAAGSLSGIGAGFDVVWRPSAEEAQAQWEAQVEMPAPAPTPGDKGRMQDGRIVIDVSD